MMLRRYFLAILFWFVIGLPTFAQESKIFNTNGIAVNGADVVGYFTEGRAIAGDESFSTQWNGAKWLFSSAQNLAMFEANPDRYAPQYGGYCAFGVAMNKKFDTDPEAWKVVDNKLYLNLDKSVQKRWLEDTAGYITSADSNWTNIKLIEADKL